MTSDYRPTVTARRQVLAVRHLRYCVYVWGGEEAPPIFFLHGWADTGMSFQFLADELGGEWRLIAPDWRGFGESQWSAGGYWFPDYLADLDAILDHFSPDAPARIAGHSMGGNVAWLYAGIRPERVRQVVSLDAFGLDDSDPDSAPGRYALWLRQWREQPAFPVFTDLDAVAIRVRELAPRLDPGRARFVASQWVRTNESPNLRHDPGHKRVNPVLYRRTEARACWRRITAPCLLVLGRDSRFHARYFEDGLQREVRECIPHLEEVVVDAGHMLHLEQPGELARVLESFFKVNEPY